MNIMFYSIIYFNYSQITVYFVSLYKCYTENFIFINIHIYMKYFFYYFYTKPNYIFGRKLLDLCLTFATCKK